MPRLFNTDHQYAIIDAETSVAPGDPHDFTDEQLEAGITGSWSEEDPRAGLRDEQEFKRLRAAKRPDLDAEARELGVEAPEQLPNRQAVIDAINAAKSSPSPADDPPEGDASGENPDPAEPGEDKE